MNITDKKLKAAIQIALGSHGVYTEKLESDLMNYIKALIVPSVGFSDYLAFMRIDYSGIFENSMRLFKTKAAAENYITELTKKHVNEEVSFDIVDFETPPQDQTKPKCKQHQFVGIYSGYEVSYLQCLNCPETKPF